MKHFDSDVWPNFAAIVGLPQECRLEFFSNYLVAVLTSLAQLALSRTPDGYERWLASVVAEHRATFNPTLAELTEWGWFCREADAS